MTKSFAQILRDQLGPQPAPTKADAAFQSPRNHALESYFFFPNLARQSPPRPSVNQIYRVPQKVRVRAKNSTVPTPHEQFFAPAQLSARENLALQTLIRLGASDLKAGFSVSKLKAAHRRLAKKLHPDVSPTTTSEFLEMRAAYATLNRFSLAGGNESASASTCPRRAAA